ncbi:nitroreductase family protein [Spiroplasma eriocheiris]|uniref:Nitroreductase n=1 Tax=Spiroplasma eriocheiris TaxID=315358 RepID=A0A0H3XJ27_9MOLU|nr:nitroreductase family protein [Spiroplasma eriocheiris]AHF57331.1 putative NAD(P)H-flavin oxidoreductase [Spiroplasma eriocheiris CCTCC M 207170]AKM53791.1 nitroreductase [Spiroplasma eriocheiris]
MSVKSTIEFRKSVRVYNPNKEISATDFQMIIEAGRLAPTSNGLEPVKVFFLKDKTLKAKAAEQCFMGPNINRVNEAPIAALILVANGNYLASPEFLTSRLGRIFQGDALKQRVEGMSKYVKGQKNMDMYSEEQAHIIASFMSLQAADLQIGTSIMGGVIESSTAQFLAENNLVDPQKYHIALGMVFGYFDETKPGTCYPRVRIPQEEFAIIK